jgi:ABC-2 type transport system permease protein
MNKTFLIFRHEFLHTIKRAGFIIMTLAVPSLALVGIGISHLTSSVATPSIGEMRTMGYVDEIGNFGIEGHTKLIRFNTRSDATQALIKGDISEYFVIPSRYVSTGTIHRYTLQKEVGMPPPTTAAIKNFLTSNLLAGKVPSEIVNLVESPLNLEVTRLTKTGAVAPEQSGIGNIIIPSVFALLLGLSLMFGSAYMLQGLGEEKESRLIEVLLSSVSVRQLLTGKVLGLGAAGLVQILVWLISAPLLLHLASSSLRGIAGGIHIPPHFIVLGILYFVLGYLLFAVLSIGVGAISPNAREAHQLALIYTFLGFSPTWLFSLLLLFPTSPVWVVLTIFPVTAPVQTMFRLGVVDIPAWQLITSMVVLVLSIIGGLSAAVRVFRVHLLIHGRRPSFAEIIRNLKNG